MDDLDELMWVCAGCGVQSWRHDNGLFYRRLPTDNSYIEWSAQDDPAHVFEEGTIPVCEDCLQHCAVCDEPVSEFINVNPGRDGFAYVPGYNTGRGPVFCHKHMGDDDE